MVAGESCFDVADFSLAFKHSLLFFILVRLLYYIVAICEVDVFLKNIRF